MITMRVDDVGIQQAFNRLSDAVGNLQPAMDEIGAAVRDRVSETFKTSTDPWGNRWRGLSQSAVMARLARRKDSYTKSGKLSAKGKGYAMGGFQPLLDTGRLRNSITYRATSQGVTIGTNTIYARTHQFGASQGQYGRSRRGPIPWGNIPARPFLPVRSNGAAMPPSWQSEIIDILQRRIEEATR